MAASREHRRGEGLRILLAGESWTSTATHIKGFDQFASVTHHRGADDFLNAIADPRLSVTYMPCHEAAERFPDTAEALSAFDVVILSDIGANTLLLPPDVWLRSQRAPNRLKALRDYVAAGGGLIMVGGYYSFQGINGGARYRSTAVADVLPVTIHPHDDRLEMPEGVHPIVAGSPGFGGGITAGLEGALPYVLGCNEVVARPDASVLLRLPDGDGGHPLLVVGRHGQGRTAAWTTDIGPHWLPSAFLAWPGFRPLWHDLLDWCAGAEL